MPGNAVDLLYLRKRLECRVKFTDEERKKINEIVSAIPDKVIRDIIFLRYFGRRSWRYISWVLGMASPDAYRMMLYRFWRDNGAA